jgi:hypothetical protein
MALVTGESGVLETITPANRAKKITLPPDNPFQAPAAYPAVQSPLGTAYNTFRGSREKKVQYFLQDFQGIISQPIIP